MKKILVVPPGYSILFHDVAHVHSVEFLICHKTDNSEKSMKVVFRDAEKNTFSFDEEYYEGEDAREVSVRIGTVMGLVLKRIAEIQLNTLKESGRNVS